jgi:ComF family protein
MNRVNPFQARNLAQLDGCFCAGDYSGWLRDSVICYKNGDLNQGELLSKLLCLTSEKFAPDSALTIIPIPSSQEKVSERGYDSILHLCKKLAKEKPNFTLEASCLVLRRRVFDQVGLSAIQRQANVDGAFEARKNLSGAVMLVDDVITTGATLNSAARVLRLAGAQQVFALALCGSPKTR